MQVYLNDDFCTGKVYFLCLLEIGDSQLNEVTLR